MALFVSSPLFVMRISMARAPGISLCLLLLATYLLLRRRDYWLGRLSLCSIDRSQTHAFSSSNYYIVGLGLHYLYLYDRDLFNQWMDITDGIITNPAEKIWKAFGADYAFCLKIDVDLLYKLEEDPQARLLYEDTHACVFALEPDKRP